MEFDDGSDFGENNQVMKKITTDLCNEVNYCLKIKLESCEQKNRNKIKAQIAWPNSIWSIHEQGTSNYDTL